MSPEARLVQALELVYRVDNLDDLREIEEALEHRRLYLQQQREEDVYEQ